MGIRSYRFGAMVIMASVLIALPRKVHSGITSQNLSDTEKANMTVNYFRTRDQLSIGVYESAIAAENLVQHISMGNTSTTPVLMDAAVSYLLKTMPDLLRNSIFQDIVKVIVEEAGKASQQSNVTIDTSKPIKEADIQVIVSKFNFVAALTRSITQAKPLIDHYRQVNDSSLFIMVLNKAIEVAVYGNHNTTFQAVMDIFMDELSQGLKKSGLLERISKEGPGFLNDINNAASIVRSVVMSSNLQRLISRSYNVSKPVLDSLYGGNTEPIYDSLTTAMDSANRLKQNPMFQILYKFLKTSNVTGQSNGNANTVNMVMNFLKNVNVRSTIKLVLGSVSSRIVIPYNSSAEEDKISGDCYEDMIDFFDAAKQGETWALKRLDSYGKIPSGLAKGNINFLGSFDECLEIRSDIKASEILGGIRRNSPRYPRSVGSKYCRVRIPIPKSIFDGLGVDTKGIPLRVSWGICIPDTCTGSDLYGLLKLDVFKNATSLVESVDCSLELDVTQDLAAVLTIILLSIFAFLMLTGTLYVSLESRGVFVDNDKSANADSAYSNLTFTKVDESKPYPTMNEVNVENGHTAKEGGKGRKEIGLPANYVPHSESDKSALDKTVDTTDQLNGAANGGTGTKAVSPTQETNAKPSRQKKEGVLVRIVKAFSVQINAPKILTGRTGLNSITCIHGIRFFSITWIMLGHTYNYGILSEASTSWSAVNFVDALSMIQRFTFQAVVAGGFSVDTFFMISGMLLAYLQLKQMAKIKAHPTGPKIGSYVMHYFFHRFWRLTPMYAVVLLIFATLLPYIGSGPLWPNVIQTSENCKQSWWTNLLYINNIVRVDSQCMGWTWFLSNDMQFYVVSIFLLFFMTLSLPLGLVISSLLLLVGTGIATWQEYVYNGNFFTMKSDGGNYWNKVYITPWCRVGAYCVGLFLGVIFYKRPRKTFSKVIGFVGWTIATAVALTLVYSTYSTNKEGGVVWTNVQNAFYEGFGRPVWSLCVAWVIFACHNDMGGYVNSILSWKALVPLSRLSYAAYLIHPMMMIIHVYSKRSLVYLTDYDMIYLFVGHATVSYMGAFILSAACEAPFMALEKILF
ncbi:uncharacterized protein LOC110460880 [Mizuhopecten yessoensis]|uniref:Nose resistant to fluoxetine protein 6 n=1 Tax=Mizuhopecten yessoensis TaxID=6573 RepID=A0A210Q1I5_MIZYE|nr:uncharacterized protein LOC110460880 [Mizuhopecten yessoensis]OWF42582.1 Nose resistant to fluoxetine protein 6 [Mizuhopecten yessoensis]